MKLVEIKIDGVAHEIDADNLTLGEKWLLDREYGPTEYGIMVGLIAVALRRADPGLSEQDARERVEALTDAQVEIKADPTPAGDVPAKARKKTGSPK